MTTDYLIIGQGICGSFLSHDLLNAGKSVMVIDENRPGTASKVASGLINPITGRRMVRTWEIEKLMPYAVQAYQNWGNELGTPLIRQCNILDFHPTPQMVLAFAERINEEKEYLRIPDSPEAWKQWFNYDFSIGETSPCWLVEMHSLLSGWRKELMQKNCLLEELFNVKDCIIGNDEIRYKGITAHKIIFCEGSAGFENPYFKMLPFARNKGEALIVAIPGLPRTHIFKQGITLVPWKEDLFWVGSSYEWDFTDLEPTPAFRIKVETQLQQWLKLPFEVIEHLSSDRPANMERRPFVGLHPVHETVGIFNGMGTKGCSLAPYFSNELASYLVNGTELHPQADVRRFKKILSR